MLQLYVAAPDSPTPRPQKELHGFEKVFLLPNEEREIGITLDRYAASYWDEIENMWKLEAGVYDVLVGVSSEDIRARGQFKVSQTRYWKGL